MPSPFPGMDPYLEAPDIWPDFRASFAAELSRDLNATLPEGYYARIQSWAEIGADGDDLVVEPYRHSYVEVRRAQPAHDLLTVIEIVSPYNKRPGRDRQTYFEKRERIFDLRASLIEIDLVRAGESVFPRTAFEQPVAAPVASPDYCVSVHRGWCSKARSQRFFISIRDPLPTIPVPLLSGRAEPTVDLQSVFQRVYDSGPYARGAVDYRQPPEPPLSAEDAVWLSFYDPPDDPGIPGAKWHHNSGFQ